MVQLEGTAGSPAAVQEVAAERPLSRGVGSPDPWRVGASQVGGGPRDVQRTVMGKKQEVEGRCPRGRVWRVVLWGWGSKVRPPTHSPCPIHLP